MNEAELASTVLARLEPDFIITTEVHGHHWTGKTLRLDAVATPRSLVGWARPDIALGIEFKPHPITYDTRDKTGHMAQAIDYAQTTWNGYGHLPIFLHPPVAASMAGDSFDVVSHILGAFNVGELHDTRHGLAFIMQGTHRIWSQGRGIEAGARWKLQAKWGRR
jgi:hypothetical protein